MNEKDDIFIGYSPFDGMSEEEIEEALAESYRQNEEHRKKIEKYFAENDKGSKTLVVIGGQKDKEYECIVWGGEWVWE